MQSRNPAKRWISHSVTYETGMVAMQNVLQTDYVLDLPHSTLHQG